MGFLRFQLWQARPANLKQVTVIKLSLTQSRDDWISIKLSDGGFEEDGEVIYGLSDVDSIKAIMPYNRLNTTMWRLYSFYQNLNLMDF